MPSVECESVPKGQRDKTYGCSSNSFATVSEHAKNQRYQTQCISDHQEPSRRFQLCVQGGDHIYKHNATNVKRQLDHHEGEAQPEQQRSPTSRSFAHTALSYSAIALDCADGNRVMFWSGDRLIGNYSILALGKSGRQTDLGIKKSRVIALVTRVPNNLASEHLLRHLKNHQSREPGDSSLKTSG